MKKILILGSNGFLGKNLCEFFQNKNIYDVYPLTRNDLDFTDVNALIEKIKTISPDIVVHSAV